MEPKKGYNKLQHFILDFISELLIKMKKKKKAKKNSVTALEEWIVTHKVFVITTWNREVYFVSNIVISELWKSGKGKNVF